MLTARTKTIERTGTGRQFPPSLASLSATKFSLQIYMELTDEDVKMTWSQPYIWKYDAIFTSSSLLNPSKRLRNPYRNT